MMVDVPPLVIATGSLSQAPQPTIPVAGLALLCPRVVDDAAAVAAAFQDPAIQRWHVRRADSVDGAREWITRWQRGWLDEREYHWAVVDYDTDTLLGRVALKALDLQDGTAGVAYWMNPAARGRRLCSFAVRTVCEWGFREAASIGSGLSIRLPMRHPAGLR